MDLNFGVTSLGTTQCSFGCTRRLGLLVRAKEITSKKGNRIYQTLRQTGTPWWVSLSIRHGVKSVLPPVESLWVYDLSVCDSVYGHYVQTWTSCIKSEIHNVSQRRQRRNELRPLVTFVNKKLSYRRGTARCVVSVEILPIATQQCRNYLYDESWTKYQLSLIDPCDQNRAIDSTWRSVRKTIVVERRSSEALST